MTGEARKSWIYYKRYVADAQRLSNFIHVLKIIRGKKRPKDQVRYRLDTFLTAVSVIYFFNN